MKFIHKGFALSAIAMMFLSGCESYQASQAVQTTAAPQALVVSPGDQRSYETLVLENGIEVILVSDPKAEKAAAALSVGVGLLNDPMAHQGMAHYLEHMLFLGTERYPDPEEYAEFMSQNGGVRNAYTWLDVTNYMFKINPDAYEEALDRFSDFFKGPLLTPELINKERNAVNAEWSMRRELDFFTTYKLERGLMGDHPANRFLIGNLETLADTEESKLHPATVAFYNQYYSANLMKVALVSNKPLAEMRKLASDHFASIENKAINKPKTTEKMDFQQVGNKLIRYVPHKDQKQLVLSFVIDNNMDQFRSKPNHYLSYLIGSEMPGALASTLREKGLISNLYPSINPSAYGNYGKFDIVVELTDKGMEQRPLITGAVLNYLDLIRESGVDSKYFEEIKTSLGNEFRFLEKSDEFSYVSELTGNMQDYPLFHAIDASYRYEQFDAGAIQQVLSQLTPEHLRLWHISKAEKTDKSLHFYDGSYAVEDLNATSLNQWQQKAATMSLNLPAINTLLPENFDIKTADMAKQDKPVKRYDQDGIEIWQQPSQYFPNQPKGKTWIYLNTELREGDVKQAVMLSLWKSLWYKQNAGLNEEARIAGISTSFSAGNGVFLSVDGFTDKQPRLLDAVLNGLHPEITEEQFSQQVEEYVRAISSSEVNMPISQLGGMMKKLTQKAGWSNPTLIETAKQLTLSELDRFIDGFLKANSLRAFMFGNYDETAVKQLAKRLQGAFPQRQHKPYSPVQYLKPGKGQRLVLHKDLPVADLGIMDFYVSANADVKERAIAGVLSQHLSQKAFDILRTKEQLGYAVGAFSSSLKDHAGIGFYIQTPVKNPQEMQARFERFKQEYGAILGELDQSTFDKLKSSRLANLKEAPKNLDEEASLFFSDWIDETWSFDSLDKMILATEQVTLAEMQQFYQQILLGSETPRINVQLRGTKFKDTPYATIDGQQVIDDLTKFHGQMTLQ